jgi:hypothetical protein
LSNVRRVPQHLPFIRTGILVVAARAPADRG